MMNAEWLPRWQRLLDFFVPEHCRLCHTPLVDGEEVVCLSCLAQLPRVHADKSANLVENRLFGRFCLEHATAYCFYRKEGKFAQLLQQAKYEDCPWIDETLARLFAAELQTSSAWPYDVDVIVPVPVHWLRRLHRTYNQSEYLARGLASVWHLPIETGCLYRSRYVRSQVGKGREQRLQAERDSFAVRHPERLRGKHVLLVDDVMTTGSTIEWCASALLQVEGVRLSVLTLGLTN